MRFWAALLWALPIGVAGAVAGACGDVRPSGMREPSSVVDALTRGMAFQNGRVRLGDIVGQIEQRVRLRAEQGQLRLAPRAAMLLPIGVESDDEETLQAVLIQFNGADSHIEVAEDAEVGGETVQLSLDFEVDADICDGLCARTFQITMLQAVRMSDGTRSETVERTVTLDCGEAGDPALCTSTSDASVDAGPVQDAADAVDATEAADITTLTAALSDGLGAAHDALCTSCSDPDRIPCYAVVPLGAIACIEDALSEAAGTPQLTQALQALVAQVEGVSTACAACDLEACAPPLLQDALSAFPTDPQSAIAMCIDPP